MVSSFLNKIGFKQGVYPRQFWLMFWGMLISTIGSSMVWPFTVVYASGKLHLPLTAAAGLITISSFTGLVSTLLGGPVIDRLGRKWVMVVSLFLNGLGYFLMGMAGSYPAFVAIMVLNGAVNPLYRVGADAMMADLIPPERRPEAYSLLRMANNLGISIGPAVGGFIISASFAVAFSLAATGLALYGFLLAIMGKETMPERGETALSPTGERFGGYGKVLANLRFSSMVGVFALVQVCASLIWVLLAVYTMTHYGVTGSQYGWIPTTNALMVVLFQFAVTQVTRRFPPLRVLAVGAFFYGVATLSVAFGTGFWSFWASMVVMTLGELMIVPTASTYTANLAPADQRARYMSLSGLTWNLASGVGPVFGGMLSDLWGPRTIWYGGGVVGVLSVLGFLVLGRIYPAHRPIEPLGSAALPAEDA